MNRRELTALRTRCVFAVLVDGGSLRVSTILRRVQQRFGLVTVQPHNIQDTLRMNPALFVRQAHGLWRIAPGSPQLEIPPDGPPDGREQTPPDEPRERLIALSLDDAPESVRVALAYLVGASEMEPRAARAAHDVVALYLETASRAQKIPPE